MDSSTAIITYPVQEKPKTFADCLEDDLRYHQERVEHLSGRLTIWNNQTKEVQDTFLKLMGCQTNQPPDEPCDTSVS